ncbi:MAG: APC family permease [Proteobacteria bacterium]|nr:APC family permease [Pseudomonadota bacterium]
MKVLERGLGLKAIIIISLAAMLGPGIFVLPGVAVMQAGSHLWLAYLFALVCVVPASLAIGELATAMPASGGVYVYIERTFGPLMGTLAGFGLWLALLFKSAFSLTGIGAYLVVIMDVPTKETALILLVGILFLNMFGMGKMSEIIGVVVMIATVSLCVLVTWTFLGRSSSLAPSTGSGLDDFSGIIMATATVVVSYAGALKIGAVAGEVKDPDRNLPRAILYSLFIAAFLYIAVSLAYVETPYSQSSKDLAPIYSIAQHVSGAWVGYIMCGIAVFTMASMANAGVLAASRFPFAMSRDQLLMPFIGKISPRFLTPISSILLSCLTVALIIVLLDVEKLAKFASVFQILIFVALNITVIVLRETRVQWYKPGFATPMYPWMPLIGIISGVILLMALSQYMIYALICVTLPGLLTYLLYSRMRVARKGVIGFRGVRKDLLQSDYKWHRNEGFRSRLIKGKTASVVVCLFGKERGPDTLIELGLAVSEEGNLEVVHLTEIPEQTSVHDIHDSVAVRSLARRVHTMSQKNKASIIFDPIISHDILASVYEISQRLHCSWLIHEWGGKHFGTFTLHNQMGWMEQHLGCHLITFRDAGIRYFRNILVILEPEHPDPLLVNLAYNIAKVHESERLMLYTFANDNIQSLEEKSRSLIQANSPVKAEVFVEHTEEPVSRIITLSEEYDLLVFLFTKDDRPWWQKTIKAKHSDVLMAGAGCSVVCLRPAKSNQNPPE